MHERDMAEKNKILVMRTGSHLYGTNTPESDEDFVGIFIPDKEYVMGMKRVDEVDFSVVSKKSDGKNDSDAVDYKLYSLQKFMRLATENNPNILEMLFVNKENIIFINDFGQRLLNAASLFVHAGLKHKFTGYAASQKKKMIMRSDNFNELNSVYDYLRGEDPKTLMIQLDGDGFLDDNFKDGFLKVGDMNLQVNIMVRKAMKQIKHRLDAFSNRGSLISKYGYDVKFGMHLVRLMLEGEELLKTGKVEFPLKKRKMLLDIRNGKYTVEEVLEMAAEYEKNIEGLYENSGLQYKPNHDKINNFCVSMIEEFYYEKQM